MSTHIGGREGQAALNPVLNKLAFFLNYSTHGHGTRSRNRNNKELICLKLIRLYPLHLAIGAFFGRTQLHSWQKGTILHPACSGAHLISTLLYLPTILLTNSKMRLENISLLDHKTKLPLSGTLDCPLLEWQPSFYRKVKMCGSKQGSYCSLAANIN